jgi:hypothetical protein
MSSRKLTKKAFEDILNNKGDILDDMLDMDLAGIDDFFECWKIQKRESRLEDYPRYGTWLRMERFKTIEFNRRYQNWLSTHA